MQVLVQPNWRIVVFLTLAVFLMASQPFTPTQLLTDPFLQFPTTNSVRVVWFTEFRGDRHEVHYGTDLTQTAIAHTTQLSRMFEDGQSAAAIVRRPVWRHEAEITGLVPDRRVPYQVQSRQADAIAQSAVFSLSPAPAPGKPLTLLLTSDHQLKPLSAANYQKVGETIGTVDAVLFAGDLVNVPDRASEWFDAPAGNAFFPVLQGRADYELEKNGRKTRYKGAALIQHAPLFPAIGNHEVMGRISDRPLDEQFNDPVPRAIAAQRYEQQGITDDRDTWIKQHSFNTDTYEEIFSLPENSQGGTYYAVTFGDVRLIVLYATTIWRTFAQGTGDRGKYQERVQDFDQPEHWGFGQHIFEPISSGSSQYFWLQQELNRPEFQQSPYKVVMLHHPPHTLGENAVPAYTDPVQRIDRDATGKITAVRYEYPQQQDYLVQDLLPLLEQAGVQLVFFGHSHLWNRFTSPSGMHFLETSNVGNSYGAYLGEIKRRVPTHPNYVAAGDPNGLEPVMPTIAPLLDSDGQPQPYIASNDITVFSLFDTGTGTIASYRFDTRSPAAPVVKFDEFTLKR